MAKRKVILDVDTGTDDAVAIILAALSPQLELLGVSTVNGNRGIEYTTENTLRVKDLLKAEFPVYKGCALPIASTLIKGRKDNIPWTGMENESENVHEDYLDLPEAVAKVEDLNAVSWLVQTLMETEEKITLIPVGPLTNIATALRIEPRIKNNIEEIIIMGGGHIEQNVTPAAEFNFWVDPEAAKIVMDSGCKLTMVPLDATHAAAVSINLRADLLKAGTPVADFVANVIASRLEGYNRWQPMDDTTTVPIHDALAVAAAFAPDVLENVVHCNVDIDVSGGLCDGQSVCDIHKKDKKKEANCDVALSANAKLFEKVLLENIGGK